MNCRQHSPLHALRLSVHRVTYDTRHAHCTPLRNSYAYSGQWEWGSFFVLVLVVFTMDTAQDMIDLILPAGPKVVIGAQHLGCTSGPRE